MKIHPSSPLEGHPLADLFPMCSPETLQCLADDMRKRGFDDGQPVVLLDGKVLDGRNRLWAAKEAGVEPSFREYEMGRDGDPRLFVYRRNFPRRDLTPSDRARLALEFQDFLGDLGVEKQAGERTRDALARVSGASARLIQDAAKVKQEAPDLWDKVEASDLSVSEAVKTLRKRQDEAEQTQAWESSSEARESVVEAIVTSAPKLAEAIQEGKVLRSPEDLANVATLPPRTLQQIEKLVLGGMSFQEAQRLLEEPLTTQQSIAALLAKAQACADDRYAGKILALGDKHLIFKDEFKTFEVYVVMKKPKP